MTVSRMRTFVKGYCGSGRPAWRQISAGGREAQGLAWYALAKVAGIPNPKTVCDIECGRDAQLSNCAGGGQRLGAAARLGGESADAVLSTAT